jgi:soluble cytochrome b562
MDRLIKEDDQFILLKLTTGETLVATIRSEDEQTISIEYPFELKTIHDRRQDMVVDVTAAAPFCGFAEDRKFTFKKDNLMFTKLLHNFSIPFYIELVEEYEKLVDVPVPKKRLSDTQAVLRKTAEAMQQRAEEVLPEDPRLEDTSEVLDYLLGKIGKTKKTIH